MKKVLDNQLFALLLGLIDGILTVLTLATGHVLNKGEPFTIGLALKVGFATSLSGACIYFFSEYSRLRYRLIHAEKELNLARHGKLATTQLGRQIIKETIQGVFISSIFNFLGAMVPLGCAVLFPKIQWISLLIAMIMLIQLGIWIGKMVYGNRLAWVMSLLFAGAIVSLVGYKLNIV
jgi:predicted membrane protein (TIGR00267 family)